MTNDNPVGSEMVLFRSATLLDGTNTPSATTWAAVEDAIDVAWASTPTYGDLTRRGAVGQVTRSRQKPAVLVHTINFSLIYNPGNAITLALIQAAVAATQVALWAADGADASETKGLAGNFYLGLTANQQLTSGATCDLVATGYDFIELYEKA